MYLEYQGSKKVSAFAIDLSEGDEFYTLIMAAYRFADTTNANKLERAFPEIIREFKERYDAPGGKLPSDKP